ncbi:acetyl-CoA carboxylase biotin carboxyl carrier protein [Sphingorhabdus sp.]|jgi:acetyl-CoA carboxylase biotin carboxyl carrier protein|uniref:acetyl-CoA carboxylase biotin carboxyl carrier protein n=1 Tax=Sphingorhabdus sp. TaxID=1902408 RepID=UPI003BAFF74D|nr:acetyl-CoA carboxylase biotin carboxyl carrier protein [Sphingomonadales bacterium]MBK9432537.1 acetyl-CoA carboxylase biotin carboxyl carrier protein [Sphingomonadales bacterium]MBL0021928.1 acetyl-CoA carboxylase biotin carboxyl carrier protein [Sphingomonadales bacterium]
MNGKSGGMHIDTSLVRELADMLNDTGLSEIEVEDGDRKIRVSRTLMAAPVAYAAPAGVAPAAAPAVAAEPAAAVAPANAVKSPMVGTAYLTPEPGAAPFVSIGDKVATGDTLLIVEAMKVMNPIIAPNGGTVKAILVESGQPVEFDQPLVVVE